VPVPYAEIKTTKLSIDCPSLIEEGDSHLRPTCSAQDWYLLHAPSGTRGRGQKLTIGKNRALL